jgi:alpha-amylase
MSTLDKKAICLYFQVHQPFRLKRFRFFDLGRDHYYYDDLTNESIMRKVADKCYLPANEIILELINKYKGKFKVTFCISGSAINQFRLYSPEVLDSFKTLTDTGMVEFLAETNSHSLASLKNRTEFERQVIRHKEMIKEFLDFEATSFRNTELIYSDTIGSWISELGFKSVLTEGAKHVLGWKSPDFLYCNSINPRLKVLLRNFTLSDDIAFRFSNKEWKEWPLTADKYAAWINKLAPKSELINIFMDYETFGEHNWKESGIFEFLRHLPGAIIKKTPFRFMTPTEIAESLQPISVISIPSPISWADEERDITAWHGNELQIAALDKLYSLANKVEKCNDELIKKDWDYLQSSDHFYYMATKFFSDGAIHAYFNPYESPYDAFINYMNILSDFELRLKRFFPDTEEQDQIYKYGMQIIENEMKIESQQDEIIKLTRKLARLKSEGKKTKVTSMVDDDNVKKTNKLKKETVRGAKKTTKSTTEKAKSVVAKTTRKNKSTKVATTERRRQKKGEK